MPAVLGEIFINLIQRLVDDFKLTDVKQINTALAAATRKSCRPTTRSFSLRTWWV